MTALAPLHHHPNDPSIFSATGWTTPDRAGVIVTGELDLAGAPLLAAEVSSVCHAAAAGTDRDFLLDLAGVTFLDSAGLRAAERAELAVTDRGWRIHVVPPTGSEPRYLINLSMCQWLEPR